MRKLDIYLRSGQVMSLSVTDWKLTKSTLEPRVTELSWTMANGDTLSFVSLADIVAVIERAA